MEKNLDAYLSRTMKKWVGSRHPPDSGRARLLRQAFGRQNQPRRFRLALPWLGDPVIIDPVDRAGELSHRFFSWTMMYSFDAGIASSRLFI
jgi:hypothetical protein